MAEGSQPPGADAAPLDVGGLRDRLLAALLESPSTLLVQRDDVTVTLRLASGARIVLIPCPEDAAPSTLQATFEGIVRANRTGLVHLVAVGGGGGAARALKKSFPTWQIARQFGFHRVDREAKLERVAGAALPQLKGAVAKGSATTPLAEERLAALLAHGAARQQEEERLQAALGGRFPWATVAIAAVCVVLFALGRYWADGSFAATLFRMGANSAEHVKAGEVWRVLASAFLHGNLAHLAVNMAALAAFGPVLEKLLGTRRYLVLYGCAALGGGLASAFLRGPGLAVGASGAIWGLMAAGVGLAIRPRGLLPPVTLALARRRAAIPLVINVLYSFTPGIDLLAHFGGGLVGLGLMLTGAISRGVDPAWTDGAPAAPGQGRPSGALTVGAAALSLALLGSVVAALVVGRPWKLGEPPALERVEVGDTGLSVELPREIVGSPLVETKGRARIFTFGRLIGEPVAAELIVNVLPEAVPPQELETVIEMERAAAQKAGPLGAERLGDARIEKIGAQPFVVVTHRMNAVRLRTWVTVFGDREVVLRVYAMPDRPSSWAGVEDRIAASLRPGR